MTGAHAMCPANPNWFYARHEENAPGVAGASSTRSLIISAAHSDHSITKSVSRSDWGSLSLTVLKQLLRGLFLVGSRVLVRHHAVHPLHVSHQVHHAPAHVHVVIHPC